MFEAELPYLNDANDHIERDAAHSVAVYNAFVLRIWQEGDSSTWRATLRDSRTGEQHAFASIDRLMQFLCTVPIQP